MAEIVLRKERPRPASHQLYHVHVKFRYAPLAGYRVFLIQSIKHDGQHAQENVRKERNRIVCPPDQIARQQDGQPDQGPEKWRTRGG